MDTCSDALAQLDDVIMHTFQQCVYHLTKVRRSYCIMSWYLKGVTCCSMKSLLHLSHIFLFSPSIRHYTPSFPLYWTPILSPAKRKRRRRLEWGMEIVRKLKERGVRKVMYLIYPPPWQGWWKCIAVPCSWRARPASLPLSPPRPSATCSSSPTPHSLTPCLREVALL